MTDTNHDHDDEIEPTTDYVCERCLEPVNQQASACPSCGYRGKRGAAAGYRYIAGMAKAGEYIWYMTIIGFPVGLLFRAVKNHYKRKGDRRAAIAIPRSEVGR